MRHIFYLVGLLCLFTPAAFSSELKTWEQERDAQSLTFESKGEDGWRRAKAWLAQCSELKLQIIDEVILQTYSPTEFSQIGYTVTREKIGPHRWTVTVAATVHDSSSDFSSHASQDAWKAKRALALYIFSAKKNPKRPVQLLT